MDKQYLKRILMSLFGVLISATGAGIVKAAAFGVDPFQSLMSGLDALIPISFGTLYVIVNVILLFFSIIFDRSNIGLATFINLFLVGYIMQFVIALLNAALPMSVLWLRVALFIAGILILCVGASLYMTAKLGVSTYDAIAITVSEKWKCGQFKYVRICTDLICVVAGVSLLLIAGQTFRQIPASVGIGTIVTAFFMGPIVDFFNRKLAIPMLNK